MHTVKELLREKGNQVWTIAPQATVYEALELMAAKNIGSLVAVEHGNVAGVFTERDYARKVILKGRSSSDTPVSQIMTASVTTVRPAQSAQECMSLMTNGHFRHLPVLEGERVIGMLSIGDLVRDVLEEQQHTIEQLEHYIRS